MSTDTLIKQLLTLKKETIYFGPQGFDLAISIEKLSQMQQGFSVDEKGNDLTGQKPGKWQNSWLVIAKDTELGDPYFVDTTDLALKVNTAIFNAADNSWELEQVANSFSALLSCLKLLNTISPQSAAQFIPEDSTVSNITTLNDLQQRLNVLSDSPGYWQYFFNCYHDWLSDDEL